jgi:signal peptidase I
MTEYTQSTSPTEESILQNTSKGSSRIGEVASTVLAVLAALGLAICIITFVFQSYQVDGPSMENTLQNNDRLVVWKLPLTWSHITGHQYVPNRGDVIIFNQDNLAEFGQTNIKQLVKRVVGLPGDRVVISDNRITIYNKQNPKGFDPDETLPYGKGHVWPITSGDIDITLKSNQIFVCGDNRTDSLDSRAFGPVSVKNIVGKLVIRVYPLSTIERF